MEAIRWQGEYMQLLDQTKLPLVEEYIDCWDYVIVAEAIKRLQVRGAPAIGAAAAFGMALAGLNVHSEEEEDLQEEVAKAGEVLGKTRPTAVNLFWAIKRMADSFAATAGTGVKTRQQKLVMEAQAIFEEDQLMNERIGQYGLELIPEGAGILTHCNAGALATAGYGTALGVIRAAHHAGKEISVFADETRPLLQGARLTAWELMQDSIPVTLITDSMAAYVMKRGLIDLVVVGADRIAANGDVANKIGTYGVALAAKAHGIPFYVAAPVSTFDLSLASGEEIPIEERDAEEVRSFGTAFTAPREVPVFNPAFDVTPAALITALITDRGVIRSPFSESLRAIFG